MPGSPGQQAQTEHQDLLDRLDPRDHKERQDPSALESPVYQQADTSVRAGGVILERTINVLPDNIST